MSSGEAVDGAPPRGQLHWRLAPGCHLYRADDGGWRALTPEGRFIRLRGADAVLSDVAQALNAQAQPGPQTRDVLAELGRRGLAERPEQPPRIASRVVLVAGENELSAAVIRCLRPWVQLLYQPASGDDGPETEWIAAADVAAADVVVVCSGWLFDTRFRELDRRCRHAGVAWHLAYAEGRHFYLGPFVAPGGLGYEDVRARRLAASGTPEELLALWAYLDGASLKPPVPWPDTGGVLVLAGLIVADVLAYLVGRVPPSAGYQLAFNPTTSALDRHPVLPLPALWTDEDP